MKKCNKLLLISFFVLGMAMQPAVLCAQKKSDSPIVEVGFDKKKARHTRAMRKSDFSMMYDIMKKNAFENQKNDILRVACIGSFFSSEQCARLLSLYSFDSNRLEALKIMSPRLIDVDDAEKIIKEFTFSSEKEKAMLLLMKIRR